MRLLREFLCIYLSILLIKIFENVFKKKKNMHLKKEIKSFSFSLTVFQSAHILLPSHRNGAAPKKEEIEYELEIMCAHACFGRM